MLIRRAYVQRSCAFLCSLVAHKEGLQTVVQADELVMQLSVIDTWCNNIRKFTHAVVNQPGCSCKLKFAQALVSAVSYRNDRTRHLRLTTRWILVPYQKLSRERTRASR